MIDVTFKTIKHLSYFSQHRITAGILLLNMAIDNTWKTREHCDIWRSEKSLTVTSLSLSLSYFPFPVRMDVFNQKPVPLHALTRRVSKPLCNRQSSGEFIWWRALLDLFVAPKRLTTRKLPLFCSDKWFWWEGGKRKSVCETSPKTLGFFTA